MAILGLGTFVFFITIISEMSFLEPQNMLISSPISLGCRSMLLRQPKLEEKMLSICRSSMLSAVSAC